MFHGKALLVGYHLSDLINMLPNAKLAKDHFV